MFIIKKKIYILFTINRISYIIHFSICVICKNHVFRSELLWNKKHLAAAFAVFAATTMSFSAFAASVDANARAYERAAAEQYTYAAPQAATPAYQSGYVTSAPRPGYKPLPAVPYTAGDMAQQMPVSKELGDPIFVAPQTTAVGLQIMDPIAPSYQPVYQETVTAVTANGNGSAYVSRYKTNQIKMHSTYC